AADKVSLQASQGEMGGGALPEVPLPSVALVFRSKLRPEKIAALFRNSHPPVIGRIADDRFMIDLKAIDEQDYNILVSIIRKLIPQI
ncbi:MAG: hypothetical protein JSU69_08140, partial [Candidatus Zixiibacteriota bacterium]